MGRYKRENAYDRLRHGESGMCLGYLSRSLPMSQQASWNSCRNVDDAVFAYNRGVLGPLHVHIIMPARMLLGRGLYPINIGIFSC